MWILGHDFSGHYNRLALISVEIISEVYCIAKNLVESKNEFIKLIVHF